MIFPKNNLPTVLVGCPVNEVKDYCIEDYLANISRLTYPNKKFYFVDNSPNFDWHIDTFIANGFMCDHVSSKGKRNQEYICECQNMIREKALNFDFLLFLECDLFAPKNIIEQMLAYNTDVVACNYFVGTGNRRQLLKMEIETPINNEPYTNRNISQIEGFLEHGTQKSRSSMHGYGCTLIRSALLKELEFHTEGKIHADSFFFMDLHAAGIKPIVHNVIIEHRNSKWSDILDR